MVDGFHILTDEVGDDYRFTENILGRPGATEVRRIAFIRDCGDRFYIGMDGRVPDVLGEENPYAYERTMFKTGEHMGRIITFVHGYFAPKGTPIPDLGELTEQQPKDLGEILERANAGETPVRIAPASFARQRVRGTDWDRLATEFEKGAHPTLGATFTEDGKLFRMLDSLESAPPGDAIADAKKKSPRAEYELWDQPRDVPSSRSSGIAGSPGGIHGVADSTENPQRRQNSPGKLTSPLKSANKKSKICEFIQYLWEYLLPKPGDFS